MAIFSAEEWWGAAFSEGVAEGDSKWLLGGVPKGISECCVTVGARDIAGMEIVAGVENSEVSVLRGSIRTIGKVGGGCG